MEYTIDDPSSLIARIVPLEVSLECRRYVVHHAARDLGYFVTTPLTLIVYARSSTARAVVRFPDAGLARPCVAVYPYEAESASLIVISDCNFLWPDLPHPGEPVSPPSRSTTDAIL